MKKVITLSFLLTNLFSLSSCNNSNSDKTHEIKTKERNAGLVNFSCAELKHCDSFVTFYEACLTDTELSKTKEIKESIACNTFVDLFKILSERKTCMRSFDTRPVPAVWVCDEGKGYPGHFIKAAILLDKLKIKSAKLFFASDLFRSTLDGESAEAFKNKSVSLEKKILSDK